MITESFKLAIKNIRRRRLRAWLTMIGIFISIATIFVLISLSVGLQGAVLDQFEQLGGNKLFVQPNTGFLGPPGSVGGDILTEKDVETIEKVRGVEDYSYFVAGNAKVEFRGVTRYMLVWGLPLDRQDVFLEMGGLEAEEGQLLEKGDSGKLLLGQWFKTGRALSKEVDIGNKVTINDEEFKAKGILKLIGNPDDDRSIMMDLDTFRILFNIPERVDFIMVQVQDGEDINEVANRIESDLRKERGETEKTQTFTILTPEELLESFGNILSIVTTFLAGIAAISLLVGGIGIANTMYTSVLERTKEIGVMKAIGAQNKDILEVFLIESGMLGLVGGIIGVLLGVVIGELIQYIAFTQLGTTLLQVDYPLWLVAGSLAFSFGVGSLFGFLPARQAAKTNVVDALRYE
ncbi:MAG: ABC transporter permease [archaeon]